MTGPRISLSFSKLSDANFQLKAEYIVKCMTNNAAFPNPDPTIADLDAAVQEYAASLVAATEHGMNNTAAKNANRKKTTGMLVQVGKYVDFQAKGNLQDMISSGFDVKEGKLPVHLGNTGPVTLANGKSSGQIVCSVPTVTGAHGYIFHICDEQPTAQTIWKQETSTRSKHTYTGLTPGKQYWFYVEAVGSNLQKTASPIANIFVQ